MLSADSKIRIRTAAPTEAAAIAAILYESFLEYKPIYTPEGFAATTPPAAEIERRFDEGPIWVAVGEGAIVGTVSAVLKSGRVYVRSMAILPAARGHAIGRRLLELVEQWAQEHGHRELFLCTTPFLDRAIRLYEGHGFRRSQEGPHELFGTPLFTMVKRL
ncbi:MAG TPA: GNAT family N-acetyltransferase [Terriglobales bacterium]|nr:GNAT family N-acetyltransferase [Terriglobales bacterium]